MCADQHKIIKEHESGANLGSRFKLAEMWMERFEDMKTWKICGHLIVWGGGMGYIKWMTFICMVPYPDCDKTSPHFNS